MKNVYKGITKVTTDSLKSGENKIVEYKQNIDGLAVDDIVAFANNDTGGRILIGVKEKSDKSGKQYGEIIGIEPSDNNQLKIENKLNNCFPKIDAEIFLENINKKAIFRIEIKPGKNKPYCSQKGTYTIRGNSRNIPLLPTELLQIYLLNESESFIKRFQASTEEFNAKIDVLKESVEKKLFGIDFDMEHIKEVSSIAASNSDENFSLSESIYELERETYGEIKDFEDDFYLLKENVDEILKHFSIEEPKCEG